MQLLQFSTERCISFDQDSLISFSLALFELTVVILFIPLLTI